MSTRVFTTADTHFEHDNILEFCRPQYTTVGQMAEDIIYRWNHVVRPQDIVYHLGDVALTGGRETKKQAVGEYLQRLNGSLYLIAGNHDQQWVYQYFDRVFGVKERKNCILSHIPVHRSQADRFRLNIHGHLHNGYIGDGEIPDPFYYCVSMEQTDFAPVPMADIIQERFHNE